MQVTLGLKQKEGRSKRRQRTLLGGKLVYGELAMTVDCVIQDMSDEGARIKIPSDLLVPKRLWLIEPRQNLVREADVVWRRHPYLGLSFTRNENVNESSDIYVRVLRRIWVEMQKR